MSDYWWVIAVPLAGGLLAFFHAPALARWILRRLPTCHVEIREESDE